MNSLNHNDFCPQFEQAMWLLLSEALSETERGACQSHLEKCSTCSDALESARRTLALYEQLPVEDIDEVVFQRAVQAAVQDAPQTRSLVKPLIYFGAPLALAASLALFWLWPQPNNDALEWKTQKMEQRLSLLDDEIYRAETLDFTAPSLTLLHVEDGIWEAELQRVENEIQAMQFDLVLSLVDDRE